MLPHRETCFFHVLTYFIHLFLSWETPDLAILFFLAQKMSLNYPRLFNLLLTSGDNQVEWLRLLRGSHRGGNKIGLKQTLLMVAHKLATH